MTDDRAGLWLIGLGPGDLDMMSVEAVAAARSCTHRFLEGYTSVLPAAEQQRLDSVIGGWSSRMRSAVEAPDELLALAARETVALLIIGDPLQATTHVDLQLRALEAGLDCHVVHGISVTTLVTGAVGLQSYRFGRQTTLVYPHGEHIATSPFETILRNRAAGLHTLVLLDLDPTGLGESAPSPMTPADAVSVMRRSASRLVEQRHPAAEDAGSFDTWRIVLCSDMGTDRQCIRVATADSLAEVTEGLLHCLVVPAPSLHDTERQALKRWR